MDSSAPMERRCTAHARSGEQCKRRPIPGGTVCCMHGGKTPVVQAKARQRLLEMVDPALAQLARLLADATVPDPVKLGAAKDILDRAGFNAKQLLEVEVTTHNGDSELDAEIARLLAELGQLGQGEAAMEAPGSPGANPARG